MPTVIMIKRIVRSLRQRFCRHHFVLMKNEYNDISKVYGGDKLAYKCSKCDGEIYFKRLEIEDEPQTERSE